MEGGQSTREQISYKSMEKTYGLLLSFFLHIVTTAVFNSTSFVSAKPATFSNDFKVVWANDHLKPADGGIQLTLDKWSGCGFGSKSRYIFGKVSMKIKLIAGDSAGTVTAFYMNSDTDNVRDELDFEFLGNRTGQPTTVQTNIYSNGVGGREQRVNLWFDPSAAYHTYGILWNHANVVFSIDDVPIRVWKNNEAKGIPFPKAQPMAIYSTLWAADDWATRGGLEKVDWTKAPFYAYYKDFDIDGCTVPGPASCTNNLNNSWEAPRYNQLSPADYAKLQNVKKSYMIYDYCTDKARYPVTPIDCVGV